MSIIVRINCSRCGQWSSVNWSPADAPPLLCVDCLDEEVDDRRKQHFAELDALSLEERLRRVEAWIYDYRPTYVAPPRFG